MPVSSETAPDPSGSPARWRFEAIGTAWSIDTPSPLSAALQGDIADRIEGFDRDWSRFRPDSLVSRMAREPGRYHLPGEAGPLLALYRILFEATAGRVSPLVGHALEDLGYDAGYRLTPAQRIRPTPSWDDALAWDGEQLTLLRPALLDVGAAGKGLLVDLLSRMLHDAGEHEHVVDGSGDLVRAALQDAAPERIALEHPADPTTAVGVIELGSGAIAASAANRRAWAGVHHIIDALTGLPTRQVTATWAVVPATAEYPAMTADGLATGLFFAAPDAFAAAGPFAWATITSGGRIAHSPDLPGEVFA
ncbi:FAD:protein FMN transferase [Schumannella soli]|uniref:FAD:protein FMN transferase n=1 Tax=Schumannella soli TaxID=2590779 RepID=A0A506XYI9_9MICO|nr:FAD:protein FMN transferase [Schumannella soli]TPW74673.1 FAD:protein FMN transferase [Schumannella soli]